MSRPNIRFKEFYDDWEQRKLGEIADIVTGTTPSTKDKSNYDGDFMFVSPVDIQGNRYVDDTVTTLTETGFSAGRKLRAGTSLFVSIGSTIGKVAQLRQEAVTNQQINAVIPLESMDDDFVYTLLENTSDNIKLLSATQAVPIINKTTFSEVEISFPSKLEQEQIGNYFTKIDNLIALHQRKCDNLKEVKKYMLQKMFPRNGEKVPEIRFAGFTGDWVQRKLGDIAKRVQGNDGRMDLPTLTISAANGWMNQIERFSGNIAGKEQKNYTLLHKGELSYNHGNSKLAKYGTVFSLRSHEEALVPRVYHSFKMTDGNADFIEYYFATRLLDRELAKLISSGARMDGLLNISFDEFMGIKFNLPSLEEQSKISDYMRKLDDLITLYQRKCDNLKEAKKYMLQNMFPEKN